MSLKDRIQTAFHSINPRACLVVGAFFLIYLVVGVKIYRDYGVSWDEPAQRTLGVLTDSYLHGTSKDLLSAENRYHGQFYKLFQVEMEYRFDRENNLSKAFYIDHLVNFLLFFSGVFVFFLIGRKLFKDWKAGLLGSVFLVLSPLLFSHSFYNSKDIPFMVFFIFAMYTLMLLEEKPTLLRTLLHAGFSAAVIAERIPGVAVPAITLLILGLRQLFGERRERLSWPRLIGLVAVYLLVTGGVFFVLYPILWHDPLNEFITAFLHFQKFEDWNDKMLFMGQFITDKTTPWYYLPVWMAITTPLLYTALFLGGLVKSVAAPLRRPVLVLDAEKRARVINLAWFFLPLVVVIAGHSVVYDTWRHVFFVYPAFLLIAVEGLLAGIAFLRRRFNLRVALAAAGLLCALSFGNTLYAMITSHPYEHIYFNALAGPNLATIKQNYEMDYWGLSFRRALEYIIANDPREHIGVMASNRAGEYNRQILPASDGLRIYFVDSMDKADYFITDYKYHPQDYDLKNEVFSVQVHGVKIASVFELRYPAPAKK